MKRISKSFIILFALCVTLVAGRTNAYAAKYTFSVTFYAGGQGTFSNLGGFQVPANASVSTSGDKVVISNLEYGDVVGCSAQSCVALPDGSKYYVRGIRLGGRDNNRVGYSVFSVYEDQDYVVAYGIKGEQTQYTINYVDVDGNELAESRTYYGNVGDEPVIAYLYIDGYTPTDYNLSQTLVSDPNENIFNFVYTQGTPAGGNEEINPDDLPDGDDDNNPDNGNDNNNNDNGNNDNGNNNNGNDNNGNDNNGNNEPVVVPDDAGGNGNGENDAPPANVIVDEDVPLANNGDKEIIDDKIPLSKILFENGLIFPIGIGMASLIVFMVLLIRLVVKSKKGTTSEKKEEN